MAFFLVHPKSSPKCPHHTLVPVRRSRHIRLPLPTLLLRKEEANNQELIF